MPLYYKDKHGGWQPSRWMRDHHDQHCEGLCDAAQEDS